MKFTFSGDKEFSWQNYANLPYSYVLDAYQNAAKLHKRKLHQLEAPAALQTSLLANLNRDPKKSRRPYSMEDFCLFISSEDKNIPSAEFGSAAMALIQKRLFPSWGLFAYKDLKEAASGEPPEILGFLGHDIIVLAPRITGQVMQGMIIALESAAGQIRCLKSPCKQTVLLQVPMFEGKYYCQENVALDLVIS